MTNDQIDIKNLETEIEELKKRTTLLERVFGRLMQIELRLDNLEFHSGAPLKPALNESLMDIKLRLDSLENQVGVPDSVPIRNDE